MTIRQLSLIAGVSYLVIFFSAIYANFFVLEALLSDPLGTVANDALHVRLGVMAFLIAAVFDVLVAWALYEMYKGHIFTSASTFFRVMHAAIMGIALFAILNTLSLTSEEAILAEANAFNNMWLIGLFFFGVHLIFLGRIVKRIKFIPWLLMLAGAMYMIDTAAHFTLVNYAAYADTFLMMVAVPAILGEMSFSIWLLWKGGKEVM